MKPMKNIAKDTKVSEVLKYIQKRVKLRDYPDYGGICRALDYLAGEYDLLWLNWEAEKRNAFAAWPKFSGNLTFPIPSPFKCDLIKARGDVKYAAELRFQEVCDRMDREGKFGLMWKGPYGTLRKELLAFLINWFEERGM